MLQYANIPFVFIATSQKVDIIDSFEKRIKSRFSHRQIFFYEDDYSAFKNMVSRHFHDHFQPPYQDSQGIMSEAEN
jgi:Cdc6-like AAA superfamily ATPase